MRTQWALDDNEATPFDALREYDRLMGEKCRDARTWRMITAMSAMANAVMVAIVFWAFRQNKVVPILVSQNEIGEVRYLGSTKTAYSGATVTDTMVQAQLRRFITNMHTIPQDPDVLRNNLKECYAALTTASATKFTKHVQADSPFTDFGYRNRTVTIESVLSLSGDSWQIDFIVRTTNADGTGEKEQRKRAVLTTALLEPPEDDMILNPMGIYVSNFDVTDIEGARR